MTDDNDITATIDEAEYHDYIASDDLWCLFDDLCSETLYRVDTDESAFSGEISHQIEQARDHLKQARKLREAELVDELVDEELYPELNDDD